MALKVTFAFAFALTFSLACLLLDRASFNSLAMRLPVEYRALADLSPPSKQHLDDGAMTQQYTPESRPWWIRISIRVRLPARIRRNWPREGLRQPLQYPRLCL